MTTRLPANCDLFLQSGFWRLRWREGAIDVSGVEEHRFRQPIWIGPATGAERLTKEQAEEIACENFLSRSDRNAETSHSTMTLVDFVEKIFVPEHVAKKDASGRTHYHAILKHVLRPEEVDRIFDAEKSRAKLKAVSEWPYLDRVRLCDIQTDDVQRLVSAGVARGYSTQTVKHIRNVVAAVFAHATRKHWFTGDNPASGVTLPEMVRKEAHTLTFAQVQELLGLMRYPEKEIALLVILTNMNVAEICGLQWKLVNLTEAWSNQDGEPIPPRTIAVRKQWYRGALENLEKKSRYRNISIPASLFPILLSLSRRPKFACPDDYVLVSHIGTPVNENNLVARRLKPIGKGLQMPWLSWQVFRRTSPVVAYELSTLLLQPNSPYIDFPATSNRQANIAQDIQAATVSTVAIEPL